MGNTAQIFTENLAMERKKVYKAGDKLPISLSVLFGLQQVATCISSMIAVPYVLSSEICPGADIYSIRMKLVSVVMFISGVSTLIQTILGMRLSLLQGPSFTFLTAAHVFLTQGEYKCTATVNDPVPQEEYENKIAIMEGSLMISSLIPFVAGLTGAVGALRRYISPLTVAPMLFLVMYSTIDMSLSRMGQHWISLLQAALLMLTIFYLNEWSHPFVSCPQGKVRIVRSRIFERYPYLIAILISWGVCVVLSWFDLTPLDSPIRVDRNETVSVIKHAAWLHLPYPACRTLGEFGSPKFNAGLTVGYSVAALLTVIETVGTYYAAARVSNEVLPPPHALNRGMMAEGIGTVLAGLFGAGSGIVTYSMNVGIMELTKVAARSMMLVAAVILMILGVFTKAGALLSTLPDPILGAIIASSASVVLGIAIANLQTVDMSLSRNMAILGWSLMAGFIVPKHFIENPIKTGNATLDDVLLGLLSLPMFVGPFVAFVLDNTAPGATRKQRGFVEEQELETGPNEVDDEVYRFPPRAMRIVEKIPLLRSMPFMPKRKIPEVAPRAFYLTLKI